MHGNVAEWVRDAYVESGYPKPKTADTIFTDPLVLPKTLYPRTVRGGSYADPTKLLRSAARMGSTEDWKMRDPQIPQSTWYHTDAPFVGFRIIRVHAPAK
jgi:formylglycine-generating enzyme required for sulfatase activity